MVFTPPVCGTYSSLAATSACFSAASCEQAAFAPLREHERFWDLIENIDLVLRHFSAGLQPEGDVVRPKCRLYKRRSSPRPLGVGSPGS